MKMKTTLAAITRNRICLAGSVVVQVAMILLITLIVIEMLGFGGNPYIGMITYMALPAMLIFGVALIVWGLRRERKRVSEVEFPELATSRRAEITEAGRVLGQLYQANVFPTMKLDWNTYPNHIGHERAPGCFRCHGGDHETEGGETLSFDCGPCHTVVAWDEANPQILELLKD